MRVAVHLGGRARPPHRVDCPPQMVRFFAVVALLLALAPAAHAQITPPVPEHKADPSLTTYVQRSGPFKLGPYATLLDVRRRSRRRRSRARSSGWTCGSWTPAARSSRSTRRCSITSSTPTAGRTTGGSDPMCPLKTTRERFYGTSEELRPLTLPPGYGYPSDPADRWQRIDHGHAPPVGHAGVLRRVPR